MRRLVALLLIGLALAGCAEDAGPEASDEPDLPVTQTTGCIRGVVIDATITPVPDATVRIVSTGDEQVTDQDGAFTFCALEEGSYFLEVERDLYQPTQVNWNVEAGVAQPPVLKIQIQRIPGLVAYPETFQFDGFYECSFATVFITDSCDMGTRTVHDAGADAVPRNLQNNQNTQYVPWAEDVRSVVQETFWDESASKTFRSSLQDTPIDNDCDCSTKHMEAKGTGGSIYDRMDLDNLVEKNTGGTQSWPVMDELIDGEVAVRGFIPFQEPTSVDYAIDLEFQIFTTFFHSYTAPDGWNFAEKDRFPVPN